MKAIKRLFLTVFAILFLLVIGGVILGYFYKDEIVARVKSDINKNFDAEIDFGSVDLSFWKSFPDVNLQLNDLKVVGQDEFAGIPLVDAKNIELDLDVMSVIQSDAAIKVNAINLVEPKIHVVMLKNGKTNYDIAQSTGETSDEPYNFQVNLDQYTIQDGELIYDDQVGGLLLEMKNLDHEGQGNFTETVFDLITKTTVEELSVKSGGIRYLRRAKGDLDMTINADLDQMKFTLKENELMVNALKVKADGFVSMLKNGDIDMDLKFNAPGNSFKNFLSLIPSAFTKDFKNVTANGQLALNGYAKGIYSSTSGKLPAFKVYLDIQNGDFKYPSLPMGVSDIFAKININSPSSNLDKMVIDIPQFKMNMGNNPFTAKLNLKTPMSDPDIDTKINGVINLADLAKSFPMEGVESMDGVITADLTADTKMSYIDRQQYDQVNMDGTLRIQNMNYNAEGLPKINIKNTDIEFTPQYAKIDNFRARLGSSDMEARGTLDNLLAYLSPDKTMTGKLSVRSNYFNVNEWLSEEEVPAETAATGTAVFDRFAFDVDAVMDKVDYDIYKLSNVSAKGNFKPSKLAIDQFALNISNSHIKGSGELRNVFPYVFENQTLEGDLAINSKSFDLNQFMLDMENAPGAKKIANEELEPVLIPEKIAVNINADVDKVKYTNMTLRDLKGKMVIADQGLDIKNAKAKTLGGDIIMNGGYDTKNAEKPTFDMDFKVESMNFKDAYNKLNTVKAFAPITQFIDGKFNTSLKMKGAVGKDMMPDLNTLTADGVLQTLDAVLSSFEPLEKIGNQLNINAFKKVSLKNTKNWFNIKDGKIEIKPFDYKVDDIAMKIGGSHGLNQDMDYLIKAKIPRDLLGKSGVGQVANKGLDFLSKQASKLGVNILQGDYIDMDINVLGTIKSPKIKIKPTGSGGQAFKDNANDRLNNLKDQAIKEAKDKLKEEADKAKEAARKKAEEEAAKLKQQAEEEAKKAAEAAAKKAEEELKKYIQDSIANAAAKKLEEEAGKVIGKEAKDKLKDLKDKWNPFGKKKKPSGGGR